jgi:glutamyl-tRNA synthetase
MVRTRIAPSPTGYPHIGTVYQVLFNYALAKQQGGKFILRIEDTDRARFVEGAEEVIYSSLTLFGLEADESPKVGGEVGPYRQSERLEIYKKYVDELLQKGHAYYCFCTKERLDEVRKAQMERKEPSRYDRNCLKLSQEDVEKNLADNIPHVIRMKIPDNETISFTDVMVGEVKFESNLIDDQVIIKSDGFPTYHLGVVVDDHLMGITHVIRGREWVTSTPKHVLLYRYFGWEMPIHIHLPLILNPDGKGKLSKRHGHASVDYYRSLGYLPQAVLNYLSNLVWCHPEGKEIYNLEEFIRLFDLNKMNSQGARFDLQKLDWMNGEYIRNMTAEPLFQQIVQFIGPDFNPDIVQKTIPLVRERIKKLSDYVPLCEFLFKKPMSYEVDLLPKKELFAKIHTALSTLSDWNALAIGKSLQQTAIDVGLKNSEFFMLLRVAISGKKISTPLNESMEILGKEECLGRLSSVNS